MITLKEIKFKNGSIIQGIEPQNPRIRSKGFFHVFTKFGWLDFSNIPKDMVTVAYNIIQNIDVIDTEEDDNNKQNE